MKVVGALFLGPEQCPWLSSTSKIWTIAQSARGIEDVTECSFLPPSSRPAAWPEQTLLEEGPFHLEITFLHRFVVLCREGKDGQGQVSLVPTGEFVWAEQLLVMHVLQL